MKQPTAALCAILATLPLSALAQASPQTRSTDGAPPNASFASARVPNAAPQGAHTETPTANAETQIASAPPIADSGTRSTLRPVTAAPPHDRRSQAVVLGTPFARAQKAAQNGDFETAARLFAEVRDSDETESDRLRAEIELAHALLALGLFDAATRRYDFVIRAGPNHPAYTEAIAGLLEVNALTGEDVLVGAILDREYGDAFARLTPAELDRVNTIVGVMSLRAGRLDEARAFFDSVSPTAVDGRRVDYLAGVLAARTGSPEVALALFERAIAPADASPTQPPDAPSAAFATSAARLARARAQTHSQRLDRPELSTSELGDLARLAKARTLYALGRFSEAVLAYEQIPRFSRFWEAALLENGWARLQNEDDGGALGTLQALHAPQFAASFQPESWILKAIVYFTHCLHQEARAALRSFEAIYGPQRESLGAILAVPRTPEFWLDALERDGALPAPIRRDLLTNQRFARLRATLERVGDERKRLRSIDSWKGSRLLTEELDACARSEEIARRVAADFMEKRLRDALARLDGFDAQKEIIELEIARVETEEMEARFDREEKLGGQSLHRPRVDGEREVHWPFQGEFWLDEIGHYRFTLKDACRVDGR